MSPSDIIAKQLIAYNNRDLEVFVDLFSPNVKVYDLKSNDLILEGKDQLYQRYKERFESSPYLHSRIENRLEIGNIVIDNEYISGFGGENNIRLVAIYQVDDEKITKMWFVRE